jgi:hypothetical protein
MKRRTFDGMVTIVGLGLSVFLFVAAGLLNWGYTFTNTTVKDQLSAQQILIPASTGNAKEAADVTAFFKSNGNKIMTTGAQAKAYATHYLGFHLSKMPTYAAASGLNRAATAALAADPTNPVLQTNAAKAASTVDTVFKGTSLQGMLLNAYAWWFMGQIAGIGAGACFIAGILLLILSILGLTHRVRTPHEVII